ncbi:MAG TPA: lactonase family protein [Thermomicrobiales bacterium]|nr:lactonase family protein [Thermomicrobiales bacterium]
MEQQTQFVYVGTYTNRPQSSGRGEGIYVYQLDPASGDLTFVSLMPDVPNPSFLTVSADGTRLYAPNETTTLAGRPGGAVSAFAIDRQSGGLALLNRQPSHGTDPCHVRLDQTGRNLLVANYTSGSVAVLPVETDGRLAPASDVRQHHGSGPNPTRQEGPHAHFITPDRSNRFVLVADLGLDQVLIYRLDVDAGTLAAHEPAFAALPPGSGPRHLAFHPSLPILYVINELASTISTCAWDGDGGTLRVLETISTLPKGFDGQNSCAEVRAAPSGRFVYGSNRGHDSIATFAVGPDGSLTPAGHTSTGGENPRNFTLDATGTYLFAANQDSDTIVTFRVDSGTGALTPTGQVTSVPSPVCVLLPLSS